jgi:glucokinase
MTGLAGDGWVVGIDLGGTKTAFGLIGPDQRVWARRRMLTRADQGLEAVVERIAQGVTALREKVPAGETLTAVGICSPGPVDHRSGMLLDPPNLPALQNAPLCRSLDERLSLPVTLEHDAKAAALGEYHYGAGRGERGMVYIVLGTGVGGAIVVNGQLYRGLRNSAGEIGHITLDRGGDLCSCGCRGCVETFVSGPALARRYQRLVVERGHPPPVEPVTGERVANLARGGDELAQRIVTEAGEALGVAIASAAMLLDVDLFVLGSSVARAADLLLEPARRTVPTCSYRSVSARVRIRVTELWDDAPILGCGWLARQNSRGS